MKTIKEFGDTNTATDLKFKRRSLLKAMRMVQLLKTHRLFGVSNLIAQRLDTGRLT
jgi:hypothetical protein